MSVYVHYVLLKKTFLEKKLSIFVIYIYNCIIVLFSKQTYKIKVLVINVLLNIKMRLSLHEKLVKNVMCAHFVKFAGCFIWTQLFSAEAENGVSGVLSAE